MENQKFDEFQIREGETHERDLEDSDQYSSSEKCRNISISIPKMMIKNRDADAVSLRAKRKTRLPSSHRSGFVTAEENIIEKHLQQKFKELSSIVPGSNMKDENSILDDAISYLKLLQERANIFEEQNKKIYVEKAWPFGDNDSRESSSSSIYQSKQALPEIEAKAQGKDVLIRVHCENQKGYLTKVLGKMEKLRLNIENISSMPFGDYFLDIIVIAKMSDEFVITTKDLKRELRETLQQFM